MKLPSVFWYPFFNVFFPKLFPVFPPKELMLLKVFFFLYENLRTSFWLLLSSLLCLSIATAPAEKLSWPKHRPSETEPIFLLFSLLAEDISVSD